MYSVYSVSFFGMLPIRHFASSGVVSSRNITVQVVCKIKTRKPEVYYQRILEKHLNGKHKKVDCGITDITTPTMHVEIKEWKKWKEAVGQLLSYNVCENKPYLRLYLFESYPSANKQIALNIFQKYNIQPYEFVEDNRCDMFIRDLVSNEEIIIKKTV